MKTKELKIQAPKGYEIDTENSTFECIKFKPIQKYITYEDVFNTIFVKGDTYFTSDYGYTRQCVMPDWANKILLNKNIATNKKQLERLLALNQFLNIAEYYNRLHTTNIKSTTIEYDAVNQKYYTSRISIKYLRGVSAIFNRKEDAQAVIDNPNFKEILNIIYKCQQ